MDTLFLLALAAFMGYLLWMVTRGAPYLPTFKPALEEAVSMAGIQPGIKIADLGSGDGRVVIALARAGAEVHGYEINPILVLWSRMRIAQAGLSSKAFIHWKNFWSVNLSEYSIIFVFGLTSIMPALEKKLQSELKPGSKVLSNIFRMPTWQPSQHNQSIYLYTKNT